MKVWVSTDKALPCYNHIVTVRVADFTENYTTEGYYDYKKEVWFTAAGDCLNDNVYEWLLELD